MQENVANDNDTRPLEKLLGEARELDLQCRYEEGLKLLEEEQGRFSGSTPMIELKYAIMKAGFLFFMSRFDEAAGILDDTAELVKQLPKDDKHQMIRREIKIKRGKVHWRKGEYFEAEELFNSALKDLEGNDEVKADGCIGLANVASDKGELDRAISYYGKAIELLEPIGTSIELVSAYNNLSDAYMRNEDYEKCLEYADKCIFASRSAGIKRQEGFGHMTGAEALVAMGDTEKAKEYVEASMMVMGDTQEPFVQGAWQQILGNIATLEGDYEKAKNIYSEANDLIDEIAMPFFKAQLKEGEGDLYKQMKNHTRAKDLYNEAIEIFRKQRCLVEIKNIKGKIKEIDEAEKQIKQRQE